MIPVESVIVILTIFYPFSYFPVIFMVLTSYDSHVGELVSYMNDLSSYKSIIQ